MKLATYLDLLGSERRVDCNCIVMAKYVKEEVGSLILGYEIPSLPDEKTCQMVNCILCFGTGMLAFYLKKNKKLL